MYDFIQKFVSMSKVSLTVTVIMFFLHTVIYEALFRVRMFEYVLLNG